MQTKSQCDTTEYRLGWLQTKQPTVASAGEDGEKLEPMDLLGELCNGAATLESSLAAGHKGKHRYTV